MFRKKKTNNKKKDLLLLYTVIIFCRAAINICFRIVMFFGFVLIICGDESMMLFFYWQYLYVFLCVSLRIFFCLLLLFDLIICKCKPQRFVWVSKIALRDAKAFAWPLRQYCSLGSSLICMPPPQGLACGCPIPISK